MSEELPIELFLKYLKDNHIRAPEFNCDIDNECYIDCLDVWNESVVELVALHKAGYVKESECRKQVTEEVLTKLKKEIWYNSFHTFDGPMVLWLDVEEVIEGVRKDT